MYGRVYGMEKTTVYLPVDLKRALEEAARARGVSEAELIREGVRHTTSLARWPKPLIPLFESGRPLLAETVDEALEGFGER